MQESQCSLKDKMISLILLSRLSELDHELEPIASSLISILNYARCSFSGLNFSRIHISHADLSYAMLHLTELSNACLHHVNLIGAVLDHALLRGCDLSDAVLQPFKELASPAGPGLATLSSSAAAH